MLLSLSRPLLAALCGCLAVAGPAHAQPLLSLKEAVEAAWAFAPQARSLQSRQAELDARERAASSLFPGPPTVSLSYRTDQVGSNGGLRESEAEVATPIWSPRARTALRAQVGADRAALEAQQTASRVRLAAEVRELAAQAAMAQIEVEVARRKLQEARTLAADVERRLKAGDVARIDLLQAQAVQQQAAGTQAQAEGALARAVAQWRALTGLSQLAALDETPKVAGEHPLLAVAEAQARAARARLASTEADRRDPMEVGVGLARERAAVGAATETSLRLALRIPLGNASRNATKLAAARAELDVAEAEAEAARRTAQGDRQAAEAELEGARRAELLAADRERLAREAQALIARSYQLGESDLPTRLRADSERFDAELAHARASVETRRAISRLNQSFGVLP